jgi:hypothetical protein
MAAQWKMVIIVLAAYIWGVFVGLARAEHFMLWLPTLVMAVAGWQCRNLAVWVRRSDRA